MEWISVNDRVPDVDYDNQKSFARVKIKINNSDLFVINCSFRHVFQIDENGKTKKVGFLFYDSEKGREYYGVTHWMPLPETPKE